MLKAEPHRYAGIGTGAIFGIIAFIVSYIRYDGVFSYSWFAFLLFFALGYWTGTSASKQSRQAKIDKQLKESPECLGKVPLEARACMHCGHRFAETSAPSSDKSDKPDTKAGT